MVTRQAEEREKMEVMGQGKGESAACVRACVAMIFDLSRGEMRYGTLRCAVFLLQYCGALENSV